MKLFLVLLILAVAALIGWRIAATPGGGTIAMTSSRQKLGWDLQRTGYRQQWVDISVDGVPMQQSLTIFGPTRQIFEPWLHIAFQGDGIQLLAIDGTVTDVPPDAQSAWIDSAGRWTFDATELPPLGDPDPRWQREGHTLLEALAERFPQEQELWARMREARR